jgi:hypothetical protein
MPDVSSTLQFLSSGLSNVISFVPAVGALGTAAMGLVDASKFFDGGPSNFGFGYIEVGLKPFLPIQGANLVFGQAQVLQTLKANWINGVAKADQKAIAKSLIHLGITPQTADSLAKAAGVDPAILKALAQTVANGGQATAQQINVLGQFDVVLSAVLDAAYERADQKYRNACKAIASCVSGVLAVIGGTQLYGPGFGVHEFIISLVVGFSATPLAPVAKDLASSLQSAVSSIQTVRR